MLFNGGLRENPLLKSIWESILTALEKLACRQSKNNSGHERRIILCAPPPRLMYLLKPENLGPHQFLSLDMLPNNSQSNKGFKGIEDPSRVRSEKGLQCTLMNVILKRQRNKEKLDMKIGK